MKSYPEWPFSYKHLICDTEDDLAEISLAQGDEAYVKETDCMYMRDLSGKWIKRDGIKSTPPSGKYRVTNLYVDPDTGKLTVEFDNIPIP